MAGGFLGAAALMVAAAVAEFTLGVEAAGKSLEAVAAPVSQEGEAWRIRWRTWRVGTA
jgi:hypothetical protein